MPQGGLSTGRFGRRCVLAATFEALGPARLEQNPRARTGIGDLERLILEGVDSSDKQQ